MDAALLVCLAITIAGVLVVRRAQSPPAANLGLVLFGVGAVGLITSLIEIASTSL